MQSSRGTLTKVRDVDICGQIQRVVHKKHAIEVMVLRYESYHMIYIQKERGGWIHQDIYTKRKVRMDPAAKCAI